MPINIAQLRNELTTDPVALGYNVSDAVGCRDAINLPRTGAFLQPRNTIEAWEIAACLVLAEYAALSAVNRQMVDMYVAAGKVNPTNATVIANFQTIFGPATTTRANLLAVRNRPGSRAEQLFGPGTTVLLEQVREALA